MLTINLLIVKDADNASLASSSQYIIAAAVCFGKYTTVMNNKIVPVIAIIITWNIEEQPLLACNNMR